MLFMDYWKAYDRAPWEKTLARELLKARRCGIVMVRAIQAMYHVCTNSVSRSAATDATQEHAKGHHAATFCSLLFYMNQTVMMTRRSVGTDGFLGTFHTLLLFLLMAW